MEDMPYWPVTTNAATLFGLQRGVGHLAGFIQPVFNVGATPSSIQVPTRVNYFYGGANISATDNRYEVLMLEADGGGESFFSDAFSMIGNLVVETIGLGPLIRPFAPFRATSDTQVTILGITISWPGGDGNVFIFIREGREATIDIEEVIPGSLIPDAAAATGLFVAHASPQPGGIPGIEDALAPLAGRKHSAIVIKNHTEFQVIGAPLFPAALQAGDVLHIAGTGGLRASIIWAETS